MNLPIWEIRDSLEETLHGHFTPACWVEAKIWAACEWLLQIPMLLFKLCATGSLCTGVPPLSLKRWESWKTLLTELAGDIEGLGIDASIAERKVMPGAID
jgi:hypothetical protein